MPNVTPNPTGVPVTTPAANPNRPVSPFDRSAGSNPAAGFAPDSVKSQPVARGIQPNIGLLHDKQAVISPFSRPDGKAKDFLAQPAASANGAQPGQPGAKPAADKAPIVFVLPKDIPDGPAQAGIQESVLQEVQQVQQPQQALQLMLGHGNAARDSREVANRFTWGARYYAVQAAETAEQTLAQWKQMSPDQRKVFMGKIQEYRDQSIAMLNTAKQSAITTYNEALKTNLIYNHFFASTGPMIHNLDPQTRAAAKSEIDDAWSRWNGSFQKDWQGQQVQAQGIMTIIDQTSAEVADHLHRLNSVVSQLN